MIYHLHTRVVAPLRTERMCIYIYMCACQSMKYISIYFIFFSSKLMYICWTNEWALLSYTLQFPPFSSVSILFWYRFQVPTGGYYLFSFFWVLLDSFSSPKLNICLEFNNSNNLMITWLSSASGKWESISKEGFHFLASTLRGQKD